MKQEEEENEAGRDLSFQDGSGTDASGIASRLNQLLHTTFEHLHQKIKSRLPDMCRSIMTLVAWQLAFTVVPLVDATSL